MPSTKRFGRPLAAALMLSVALTGCGVLKGKGPKSTPTVGDRMPILSRIDSGSSVDQSIQAVPVQVPAPYENTDFAQGGGSASKALGNLAFSASPTKAWTVQVPGSTPKARLAASPVVGNGQMFVMDTRGSVHAFNATTGAQQWTKSFEVKKDGKANFGGGASYDDGKVYITTGLGEVAALDATTGNVLWKIKPAGPLRGSPTVAFGSVYVMTQDNQLIALAAADGATLWNDSGAVAQTGVFGVGSPAAGQGTVIAGYSSGELAAYRYENGRELWTDSLSRTSISTSVSSLTDIDADPIIDQGRVYALGQGGRMAAYELVTGQRIWELNIAGISTPVLAGDWVFTLTDDARMLCINRASGKIRWIAQLPGFKNMKKKSGQILWTGPVLADGRLYAASSQGKVVSLSIADGAIANFVDLKKPITQAPILANKTLYVLDDSGRITAFR